MIDIDKFEALAKAATLGPYFPQTYNDGSRQVCGNKREGDADNDEWTVVAEVFRKCDQEYQVAANPDAILALIAEVRALRSNIERYQMLCAAAYQMAGTANAPVRFLDALSDGANGELESRAKTDDLLPIASDEIGAFPSDEGHAYREDAGRWRAISSVLSDDGLHDIAIIVAAEKGVDVANGYSRSAVDLIDAARAKEPPCSAG